LVGEDEKTLTKRSTENTEAYQLYLKGRFHWNKRKADDLQKAVDYFNQAIEKDPGYALGYAGLASTYALLPEYSSLPAKDCIPKIELAARKALDLDATLAEPHAALGLVRHTYQWDWMGAEKEFKRAIELNPNNATTHHWYCICLRAQGKFEPALSEIKRAQELDPLSPIITINVGEVLFYMQRYDLAKEQFTKALEFDPNFSLAHLELGQLLYDRQSKFDEAIGELQKVRQIVGADNPYGMGP
jgi:Tfp pilus assembly protein PilF